MKVIIDRFEEEFAVVELSEGKFYDLPRALLPDGAKVGDVISIEIDADETEARRARIGSLRRRLFKKG